jgi:hypothetical protein
MRPPAPAVPSELVERIIHAHQREGIAFAELQQTTAVWPDELSRMIHMLRDQRLIEARADAKLYPRSRRRRKPEPRPTFWARLRAVFAP